MISFRVCLYSIFILLVGQALVRASKSDVPSVNDTAVDGNSTGRSFGSKFFPGTVTLPFSIREIGMLECMGADHATGGTFFQSILGEGNDFGGNYLCGPTCGGTCIPNQDIGYAPVSLYPFGCECRPDRCDAEGPIIESLVYTAFKVLCVRDSQCTCQGMSPGHHVGYLCNWLNLNSTRLVSFLDIPPRPDYHPRYSPIRWCSCCPQSQQFPPPPYPYYY